MDEVAQEVVQKVNKLNCQSSPLHSGQLWLVKMSKPFNDDKPDVVKSSEYILKTRYFILFKIRPQYALAFPLTSQKPKSKFDVVIKNADLGITSWNDQEISTIHCGEPQRIDITRFIDTRSFMISHIKDRTMKMIISIYFASLIDEDFCEQETFNIIENAIAYNEKAHGIADEKPRIINSSGAFYAKYNQNEDSEIHQTYKWLNGLHLDYKYVELEDDEAYYNQITDNENSDDSNDNDSDNDSVDIISMVNSYETVVKSHNSIRDMIKHKYGETLSEVSDTQ